MTQRDSARDLAQKHLAAGDPVGWFEALYASAAASSDAAAIPWADLAPNPNLLDWFDAHPVPGAGRRALVVGCGLGDDAEELARRGFEVTAFDVAPTAIAWCKRRFPQSRVRYVVADMLDPPAAWAGAFEFILESYTLQALPPDPRARAERSLAGFLAPAGELLVICRAREPDEPEGQAPWPLTRDELTRFAAQSGLVEQAFEDYLDGHESPPVRRFRAAYRRAQPAAG